MDIAIGKNKPNVRDIMDGDFSFSRQVELLNEVAEKYYASRTPEVKGYSREQMEQCWEDAILWRESKIGNKWMEEGYSWDKMKEMGKSKYFSSIPTPSTDEQQ